MINYEAAHNIAIQAIAKINSAHDFIILDSMTIERKFGWIFFYVPRKYLETKNPKYLIPGTAPIVVEKKDGTVAYLSTSIPPTKAIEQYEAKWIQMNK